MVSGFRLAGSGETLRLVDLETFDANSELFKENVDDTMYKNPYEIRFCDLISVSLVAGD